MLVWISPVDEIRLSPHWSSSECREGSLSRKSEKIQAESGKPNELDTVCSSIQDLAIHRAYGSKGQIRLQEVNRREVSKTTYLDSCLLMLDAGYLRVGALQGAAAGEDQFVEVGH